MADLRGLPGSSTEKWRWQRHGACRGANPELFFHPDGKRGPGHRRREQAAAAICRGCPVVADCRAHALASPEPHGALGERTRGHPNRVSGRSGPRVLQADSGLVFRNRSDL